jgi:uncharacterized protein
MVFNNNKKFSLFEKIVLGLFVGVLVGSSGTADARRGRRRPNIDLSSEKPVVEISSDERDGLRPIYYCNLFKHIPRVTLVSYHGLHKERTVMRCVNGLPTGKQVAWYENGRKMIEETYASDTHSSIKVRLEGTRTGWYEDGQKAWEIQLNCEYLQVSGGWIRPDKVIGWHENGRKRVEFNRRQNGNFEGEVHIWYSDGQIKEVSQYNDGKLNETQTKWHENGQKAEETKYDYYGRPEGVQRKWSDNGQIIEERNYREGKLEGRLCQWNRRGRLTSEKWCRYDTCSPNESACRNLRK